MDRFEQFMSRLGLANDSRRQAEKRSSQSVARGTKENRHLSPAEAQTLAQRVHELLAELGPELSRRKVSRTDVCRLAFSDAETNSRELYRVILPPGTDWQKRGLRMHLAPYCKVVSALEKLTQRREGELIHRLVEGTACDDLRNAAERWRDLDRLVVALENLVAGLDQEFGWTETYRRTLELRAEGIKSGHILSWPLIELDRSAVEAGSPEDLEEYLEALEGEANGTASFYRSRPQSYAPGPRQIAGLYIDMGAIQDSEFFFVPHAPIGHVALWDLPQRRTDVVAYERQLVGELQRMRASPQNLDLPTDEWDASAECPTGQLRQASDCHLQYHVWLIVYPLPGTAGDRTLRIGPALYQAGEESGAWIMPLTPANLAAVADAAWVDRTRHSTLLDRLAELLLPHEADSHSLAACLRRTGGWLRHNPVMKAEQRRVQFQQQLRRIASNYLPRR